MILFLVALTLLLFWHALADYPLQGDFLARAKNPYAPLPGVPWAWCMAAHCAIHAGGVFMITWVLTLGATPALHMASIELPAHWLIDSRKCAGALTFSQDQMLHVLVKVGYAVIIVGVASRSGLLWAA